MIRSYTMMKTGSTTGTVCHQGKRIKPDHGPTPEDHDPRKLPLGPAWPRPRPAPRPTPAGPQGRTSWRRSRPGRRCQVPGTKAKSDALRRSRTHGRPRPPRAESRADRPAPPGPGADPRKGLPGGVLMIGDGVEEFGDPPSSKTALEGLGVESIVIDGHALDVGLETPEGHDGSQVGGALHQDQVARVEEGL